MPFAIGENVGPYRILEQLGQGGMATIYKAYHPALDRYVAIKVLHQAFTQDPNFLKRFGREAQVVARLEHPSIVPIYDYSEHSGQPYLVMKFIEGETLKARLSRGPLSVPEMVRIIEAVGEALAYAHKQGVLHRDIKPSNILLSPDGSVYLADFGLAKMAQAGESTLSSDMLLGTPHYISPEQAKGDKNLDAGTDIYSLGVVLYELTVGRVPFSADTPFSIIHDHIYSPLPPPSQVNPRVPKEVERVLLKALAKERADRFVTVEELVLGFKAAVKAAGVRSRAAARTQARDKRATTLGPSQPVASVPDVPPEPLPSIEGVDGGPREEKIRPSPVGRRKALSWVLGGLALTCLCGLMLVIGASQGGKGDANQEGTQGRLTAAVTLPPSGLPGLPASLVSAQETAKADPGKPEPHYALAEQLERAGRKAEAVEQYAMAGDLFLKAGMPLEAAKAFNQGVHLTGGPDNTQPKLVDSFVQAMYFAAPSPRILPLLDQLDKDYPQWEIPPVIRARSLLHSDQLDRGKRMVGDVLTNHPEHPLARAVQAEYEYLSGNPKVALDIIEAILKAPDISPWLRATLEELRSRAQGS